MQAERSMSDFPGLGILHRFRQNLSVFLNGTHGETLQYLCNLREKCEKKQDRYRKKFVFLNKKEYLSNYKQRRILYNDRDSWSCGMASEEKLRNRIWASWYKMALECFVQTFPKNAVFPERGEFAV